MMVLAGGATLVLSLVFALGGVGAAAALIPTLHGLGVDLDAARPIGLLVNVASLMGATYVNLRSGRIKLKEWLPLIIASLLAAPAGAHLSQWVPEKTLLMLFAAFLVITGPIIFLGHGKGGGREVMPPWMQLLWGSFSGLISGLLGVGSGGILIPILCLFGFQSKRIATVTALIVPFASFAGFLAYAQMGTIDLPLTLVCASMAIVGGIVGTRLMHERFSQTFVRRLLSVVILAMAVRIMVALW